MRIRTKLGITAAFTVAVFGGVITANLIWSAEAERLGRRAAAARDLNFAIFAEAQAWDEYALSRDGRRAANWAGAQAGVDSRLLRMASEFRDSDEAALLATIRRHQESLKTLAARAAAPAGRTASAPGIFAAVHAAYRDGLALTELIAAKTDQQHRRIHRNGNAVYVLLAGLIAGIIAVMHRGIQRPLKRLQKGTERVAGGCLDCRVDVKNADEFGDLAAAFNHMTGRLRAMTVSRDELAREVETRRRAERVLAMQARIAGIFAEAPDDEAFNETLKLALEAVESPFGVFGYLDETGALVVPTMTRQVWDRCQVPDKTIVFPRASWGHGAWSRAIQGKRPVLSNDPSVDIPAGHVAVNRHISVPLMHQGEAVGLLQVANKDSAYQEDDLALLEALAAYAAPILVDRRRRERSEAGLRQSEQRLRTVLDSMDALAYVADMKTGELLFMNRYGRELFGDHAGSKCWDVLQKGQAGPCSFCTNDKLTAESGAPAGVYRWEFQNTKTGRWFECRDQAILWGDGRTVRFEIATDITEHRRLEEQLRQAQKMEAVGVLAGGIAHDFNNILSAIIGYGQVALMDMAGGDRNRQNIEQMLEAADRAAQLTQSLLAFSRKQVIDRKPLELNAVVRRVEKFLTRIIGEDVAVRLKLDPGPLTLQADAGQLEQVFMNFATNARDAMPGGGILAIETARAAIDEAFVAAHGYGKPGAYAVVTVSDSGAGMDEATRKRIFEPFFTTKEVGKGTGLGLAIVYGIVKQHDGYITVYSEPGKGTAFKLYLPLVEAEAAAPASVSFAGSPQGGTETILVAEDDPALRKLTRAVLEGAGYEVIVASDGAEAVEKFREHRNRIGLLLFDLIMPGKSGKEAWEEIRKDAPAVPVLFTSGYSPDLLQQRGLLGENVSVVLKPVKPTDLLNNVRERLDKAGRQETI